MPASPDPSELHEILFHAHEAREEHFGAVNHPLYQNSIHTFEDLEAVGQAFNNPQSSFVYTRGNNPTVRTVERKLAALQGAEDARLFASGMAAISAAIMSQLKAGDHWIHVKSAYSWVDSLAKIYLPRFGITATEVDGTDSEAVLNAIRPTTRVVYLESPTTFLFELQDISQITQELRSEGIVSVIDNSWATPRYLNPHSLGVDLVCHSVSKYLAGHSDVVAGLVTGEPHLMAPLFEAEMMQTGGVIAPFVAWQILRGLRTFEVRMDRHEASALLIAQALDDHPAVERVRHPALETHPQHALFRKMFSGSSGLFSFELKSRKADAIRMFVEGLDNFLIAISWGGYESLIICPVAFQPKGDDTAPTRHPINLCRVSIGLENPQTLLNDLTRGLDRLAEVS